MKLHAPLAVSGLIGLACVFSTSVRAAQADAMTQAEFTEAQVRKVDKANRQITLKHGEIKNLNMGPMTMVFHLSDAAALVQIKAGDKVRFRAVDDAGKYTVTDIQPIR